MLLPKADSPQSFLLRALKTESDLLMSRWIRHFPRDSGTIELGLPPHGNLPDHHWPDLVAVVHRHIFSAALSDPRRPFRVSIGAHHRIEHLSFSWQLRADVLAVDPFGYKREQRPAHGRIEDPTPGERHEPNGPEQRRRGRKEEERPSQVAVHASATSGIYETGYTGKQQRDRPQPSAAWEPKYADKKKSTGDVPQD
jgi:hypothetical protein